MPRVKRGTKARKRRKKILKTAKSYYGARSRLYRIAAETVAKALIYAYRDRKARKRDLRKLWIIRINAAARQRGMSYSILMGALKKANVEIDRKILADMAVNDPSGFTEIVELAKNVSAQPSVVSGQ